LPPDDTPHVPGFEGAEAIFPKLDAVPQIICPEVQSILSIYITDHITRDRPITKW
jgi:hypothetical protein